MRLERWFYTLPLRVRSLLHRAQVERELDEELRYHVERQFEENVGRGMTAEEARYAALRAIGGAEQQKERCRDMRRVNLIEDVARDLRYTLRVLAKSPVFTSVAVITLALGIGANTAIFSVVNAVLLRPLPYREPNRIVWVWGTCPLNDIKQEEASYPDFNDWRQQSRAFDGMGGSARTSMILTGGDGEPERVPGAVVVGDFFSVLGVEPMLGRKFLPEENESGKNRVVILSYGLWQRRFGGDPKIVGQTVSLQSNPYTVVGVMPPKFEQPEPGEVNSAQLWLPLEVTNNVKNARRGDFLGVVARLKPGATIEQARSELQTIAARLAEQYPPTNTGWSIIVLPLHERFVADVRPALLVLLGAVGFLLLIACANVANLLLARSTTRARELAVRAALGAGRARIVRQLLTENVALSVAGGALGLLLAYWGVRALVALSPGNIPRLESVGIDRVVLLFTLGLSVATGLVFGLLPALSASNLNLNETLKEGGRTGAEG
ncbi:MAG: ABC transporter permease, partial [Acidobacteriota bacterium]|nr:ABC transporter permease [Acidobacteriota bacterium]